MSQKEVTCSNFSTTNHGSASTNSSTANFDCETKCRRHLVLTSIDVSVIEGIFWIIVGLASFWLNASALHTLNKKRRFKKIYRIYLSNVFICNLFMGSLVFMSYAIIRLGFKQCILRDMTYAGTIIFTNVNQISMIFVICCQLKTLGRVGTIQATLDRISMKLHIAAVVFSWILSAGFVVYKIRFESNTKLILTFTWIKIVAILLLNFFVVRTINKCSALRSSSSTTTQRSVVRSEKKLTKNALQITATFLCITIATWFPLLVIISLQRFNVVAGEGKAVVTALVICVRIVFLGPLVDPMLYFWSQRKRRVNSVQRKIRLRTLDSCA